jgi:hypothetical protein
MISDAGKGLQPLVLLEEGGMSQARFFVTPLAWIRMTNATGARHMGECRGVSQYALGHLRELNSVSAADKFV